MNYILHLPNIQSNHLLIAFNHTQLKYPEFQSKILPNLKVNGKSEQVLPIYINLFLNMGEIQKDADMNEPINLFIALIQKYEMNIAWENIEQLEDNFNDIHQISIANPHSAYSILEKPRDIWKTIFKQLNFIEKKQWEYILSESKDPILMTNE